jgi:hypothetical protein
MDITIQLDAFKKELEMSKVDAAKFQKMVLLYNAIECGWSVKKRKDSYIFTKAHEGRKEIVEDSYLTKFMKKNLDFSKLIL